MTLAGRVVFLTFAGMAVGMVGCAPTATTFRGSTNLTMNLGPGAAAGSHGGAVAPSDAHACWWTNSGRGRLSIDLGPGCRVTSTWSWNRNVAGGGGAIFDHQPCTLAVGDTHVSLTTTSGVVSQSIDRGPIDVTVDGTTADGRYVSLRFSGAALSFDEDPWCTALR